MYIYISSRYLVYYIDKCTARSVKSTDFGGSKTANFRRVILLFNLCLTVKNSFNISSNYLSL